MRPSLGAMSWFFGISLVSLWYQIKSVNFTQLLRLMCTPKRTPIQGECIGESHRSLLGFRTLLKESNNGWQSKAGL